MKSSGRNIKRRLYGELAELKSRVPRARYFRGHGVHSPFVYTLVRQVFMRRGELAGDDRRLYEALLAAGVSHRRAAELQNLFIHCGYDTFGLNRVDVSLCVLLRELPQARTLELVAEAAKRGTTVALMSPYDGRERLEMCRELVAAHHSTSVDNRGYLLIFNNYLPKQHFRI